MRGRCLGLPASSGTRGRHGPARAATARGGCARFWRRAAPVARVLAAAAQVHIQAGAAVRGWPAPARGAPVLLELAAAARARQQRLLPSSEGGVVLLSGAQIACTAQRGAAGRGARSIEARRARPPARAPARTLEQRRGLGGQRPALACGLACFALLCAAVAVRAVPAADHRPPGTWPCSALRAGRARRGLRGGRAIGTACSRPSAPTVLPAADVAHRQLRRRRSARTRARHAALAQRPAPRRGAAMAWGTSETHGPVAAAAEARRGGGSVLPHVRRCMSSLPRGGVGAAHEHAEGDATSAQPSAIDQPSIGVRARAARTRARRSVGGKMGTAVCLGPCRAQTCCVLTDESPQSVVSSANRGERDPP
jgi:hypothetical protein